MTSTPHREIETKYDPPLDADLPDLTGIGEIERLGKPVEHRLEASYFDTERLDLARRGITMRRRAGGDDPGWHLKLPEAADEREEHHLPLGRAARRVPAPLVAPVRGITRGRALGPVARVSTARVQVPLLGPGGAVLALLCDDDVTAESLGDGSSVQRWREWEVELVDGDRTILTALDAALASSAATRSARSSKLARALGDRLPPPGRRPPSRKKLKRAPATHLLRADISKHLARLETHDLGVRTDNPASIHKMRIAARHLRSALTTYGPLLDPGSVKPVRDELRWLGQVLGEARDVQVLRERLTSRLAAQRPEDVVGAVADRVVSDMGAAYEVGRTQALKALDSARYFRLLETLDRLAVEPPVVPAAARPGGKTIPSLLQRDAKRLRRAIKAADDSNASDQDLHEARKKAKRLRYAAESAVPVYGSRAKKLAKRAQRLQETLGDHQDSVVARGVLKELAADAHDAGESAFTYGRLHALEEQAAHESVARYRTALDRLPLRRLDRWIRG